MFSFYWIPTSEGEEKKSTLTVRVLDLHPLARDLLASGCARGYWECSINKALYINTKLLFSNTLVLYKYDTDKTLEHLNTIVAKVTHIHYSTIIYC